MKTEYASGIVKVLIDLIKKSLKNRPSTDGLF